MRSPFVSFFPSSRLEISAPPFFGRADTVLLNMLLSPAMFLFQTFVVGPGLIIRPLFVGSLARGAYYRLKGPAPFAIGHGTTSFGDLARVRKFSLPG